MSLKVGRIQLGEGRWQPGSLQLCRGQDQSKMLVTRALTLPSMEWECCLAQFTLKNLRSWILDRSSDQTKDCWGFKVIDQDPG